MKLFPWKGGLAKFAASLSAEKLCQPMQSTKAIKNACHAARARMRGLAPISVGL